MKYLPLLFVISKFLVGVFCSIRKIRTKLRFHSFMWSLHLQQKKKNETPNLILFSFLSLKWKNEMKMHKENTVILNFTSTSSIAAFSHSKSILDACAKRLQKKNTRKKEKKKTSTNKKLTNFSVNFQINQKLKKRTFCTGFCVSNLFRFKPVSIFFK